MNGQWLSELASIVTYTMNSIPKNEILEFNNDTFSYLRKHYKYEQQGEMDEAINLLDDWIKKQRHFINTEYSREYLERTIILLKGSIERAKKQMERLATLKTLLPHAFGSYDAKKHFQDSKGLVVQALLPKLTEDHYRIFALKFLRSGITSKTFSDCYRNGVLICEYIKAHDYCNGFVGIIDYRDISMSEIISAIDLFEISEISSIITEGYSMRIKGIHLITASKLVEIIIGIFRKALGTKVGNRIHVHADLESLHKHVSKDILPVELGGSEGSLVKLHDQRIEVFTSKENLEYFERVSKFGTEEKYRPKGQFSELHMGMTGSFRNLRVD